SLASEFGIRSASLDVLRAADADVVINTLPASAGVEIPRSLLRRGVLYVDVAYGTTPRPALDAAHAAGAKTFDGMDFLRAQALRQFDLFTSVLRRDAVATVKKES
ncbi:MAG: hypothetical protein WBX15_04615, partial [Thermoanaerobaculia bacterium]